MTNRLAGATRLGIGILLGAAFASSAYWFLPDLPRRQKPAWETPYQAVLLTNGEAYYGRLEGLGSAYPTLTEIYYVRRQPDPKDQQAKFVLVKRGKEWHRPDRMLINANHILLVEPVHPDSDVAKAIRDSKDR